jgi:phage shock protein C
MPVNHRLYRSPDDRIIAGVAGGMAEAYDLDPALVRVGWALLMLVTGGVFLLLYIIMIFVVPLRPPEMSLWGPTGAPPPPAGPDGQPDPAAPQGPDAAPAAGFSAAAGQAGAAQAPPPYYYRRHREHRDGTGALVFGVILIALGAYFLVRQFIPAIDFSLFWPVIVILGGILLIVAAFGRPRSRP